MGASAPAHVQSAWPRRQRSVRLRRANGSVGGAGGKQRASVLSKRQRRGRAALSLPAAAGERLSNQTPPAGLLRRSRVRLPSKPLTSRCRSPPGRGAQPELPGGVEMPADLLLRARPCQGGCARARRGAGAAAGEAEAWPELGAHQVGGGHTWLWEQDGRCARMLRPSDLWHSRTRGDFVAWLPRHCGGGVLIFIGAGRGGLTPILVPAS